MKKILNQIDQQLLINRPHLWATQLHTFLFAYIFMMAAILLIGFTFPISTANVPDIEAHFIFPFVLSGIAYLIWLYRASLFKVSEHFGNINALSTFKTQLVYLLITVMLAALPFVYVGVLTFRVTNLVSAQELGEDCEKLSNWGYHTFNFHYDMAYTDTKGYIEDVPVFTHKNLDQIKEHIKTVEKYGGAVEMRADEILANFKTNNLENGYINDTYLIEQNIATISKAQKEKFFFQDFDFYWFFAVGVFAFLFMAFVLLATSFRMFILSVLVGIIGTMGLGVFSAFIFRGGGNEKGAIFSFILVVAGLVWFGVTDLNRPLSRSLRQISLSIATVLTPFIPLAFIALLDINSNSSGSNNNFELFMKFVFIISITSTWFLWQHLYFPTLKKIQTIPIYN